MDFVRTSPGRKFLRLILGLFLSGGAWYLIFILNNMYLDQNKQVAPSPVTTYFFQRAFPQLFISFMMYGPFLNLCQYLKLVGNGEKLLSYENMKK
jgi:hypothetical protein